MSGISGAASWGIGLSSIGEIATDDLGYLMGSVLAWNSIGFTIGPLIGGVLYEFLGYKSVFVFIIVLSCIAVIHRSVISEEYLIERKKDWLMSQDDSSPYDEIDSFATLLSKPPIQLGLILTIFNGCVISGLEPILPLYLSDEFNLNPSHIGLVFICLALPNIALSSAFGGLADKYGNLRVMIVGMLAASLANVLVGISTLLWLEIIALLLLGSANCAALSPIVALIGSGTTAYGKVYSLFNCSWAVGMFIGPSIATFIYSASGFRTVMCLFASVVLLNSIVTLAYYKATRL